MSHTNERQKETETPRIDAAEWEWFGTAGHFICGQWCRFHMVTKVGDWLVPTLGEYVHPRHSQGSEQKEAEWLRKNWPGEDIGCDRKYETMVFPAGPRCESKECGCRIPEIDGSEVDFLPANTRGEAAANHMQMCRKYSAMAEGGQE